MVYLRVFHDAGRETARVLLLQKLLQRFFVLGFSGFYLRLLCLYLLPAFFSELETVDVGDVAMLPPLKRLSVLFDLVVKLTDLVFIDF